MAKKKSRGSEGKGEEINFSQMPSVKLAKKTYKYAKNAWDFVWHGKGWASYLVFIVVVFLLLKYVAFPVFLWVFGWNDVVSVLSGSMRHEANLTEYTFYDWAHFYGYNDSEIETWPFLNGLYFGDAVVVVDDEIDIGDVIVYSYGADLIIHRVIAITVVGGDKYYTTKGDANPLVLDFEAAIPEENVIGKAESRVPFIGIPRAILYFVLF